MTTRDSTLTRRLLRDGVIQYHALSLEGRKNVDEMERRGMVIREFGGWVFPTKKMKQEMKNEYLP